MVIVGVYPQFPLFKDPVSFPSMNLSGFGNLADLYNVTYPLDIGAG